MFNNYEYFLAINKYKSITKAAGHLCISQPSLSKYLFTLETRLNVKLFDRKRFPLTLTEQGELYLDSVYKYQAMIEDLQVKLRNDAKKITIKIGIPLWRSSQILPVLLKTFNQVLPECLVSVIEKPGSELYEQVLQEKIDFCFLNVPKTLTLDHDLDFLTLENETIDIAYNTTNSLVNNKAITAKDIDNQNVILLQDNQFLTLRIKEIFDTLKIQPKKIFNTISLNTALNIVSDEDYVTFVPNSRYKGNFHTSNIVYSPLNHEEFSFNFGIIYLKKNIENAKFNTCLNIIKSLYA